MTDDYFPPLDAKALVPFRSLQNQLRKTPDLLKSKDCPYSKDITEFLTELFQDPETEAGEEADLGELEVSDVYHETQLLFQKLKKEEGNIGVSDTKDRLSYFSTMTRLLDKLTTLIERNQGIKEFADFQDKILEILDRILDTDQRGAVIDEIGLALKDNSEDKSEDKDKS